MFIQHPKLVKMINRKYELIIGFLTNGIGLVKKSIVYLSN